MLQYANVTNPARNTVLMMVTTTGMIRRFFNCHVRQFKYVCCIVSCLFFLSTNFPLFKDLTSLFSKTLVTDPRFTRGRRQPPCGGTNLLFDNFTKKCMKMKKFWPGGASLTPPRSANAICRFVIVIIVYFQSSVLRTEKVILDPKKSKM